MYVCISVCMHVDREIFTHIRCTISIMCLFQYQFELTLLIFPTQVTDAFFVTVAINGKYFPIRSSPIDLSSGNTVFSVGYKPSLCV